MSVILTFSIASAPPTWSTEAVPQHISFDTRIDSNLTNSQSNVLDHYLVPLQPRNRSKSDTSTRSPTWDVGSLDPSSSDNRTSVGPTDVLPSTSPQPQDQISFPTDLYQPGFSNSSPQPGLLDHYSFSGKSQADSRFLGPDMALAANTLRRFRSDSERVFVDRHSRPQGGISYPPSAHSDFIVRVAADSLNTAKQQFLHPAEVVPSIRGHYRSSSGSRDRGIGGIGLNSTPGSSRASPCPSPKPSPPLGYDPLSFIPTPQSIPASGTGPASINPVDASLSGVTSGGPRSTGATNTAGGVSQQTPRKSQQSLQPPETPPKPSSAVQRLMAATAGLMNGNNEPPTLGANGTDPPQQPRLLSRQDAFARIRELQRTRPETQMRLPLPGPSTAFGPADAFVLGPEEGSVGNVPTEPFPTTDLTYEGLQVFTLGHPMPRSSLDDESGNWAFDPDSIADAVVLPTPRTADGGIGQSSEGTVWNVSPLERQRLRVRRSTYVPGWSVPPRVLLVEDDAVSRKLSSKFLQIFGCTIDVAVDGVGAVNKMNLEKYDLVLMVR